MGDHRDTRNVTSNAIPGHGAHHRHRHRHHRLSAVPVAVALVLVLVGAACSSDDGGDEGAEDTVAISTTSEATTTAAAVADGTVVVTARDYEFGDVPEVVPAGTVLSLSSEDGGEPHEMVVVRIPDDETRPAEEIMALPEDDISAILTGAPALVTQALPGTTDDPGPVLGDGTLTDPGRYVLLCGLPQGTTVEDVQDATGPLDGENPHYTLGMVAELTVE